MNEKTKRIFLKPCPICGSAPELNSYKCDPWGDGAGYVNAYYYQCSGCQYIKTDTVLDTYHRDTVEDRAKEVWNEAVDDIVGMIKEHYNVKEK